MLIYSHNYGLFKPIKTEVLSNTLRGFFPSVFWYFNLTSLVVFVFSTLIHSYKIGRSITYMYLCVSSILRFVLQTDTEAASPIPSKGEICFGNEEENFVVRGNNRGHIKRLSDERMKRKQSSVSVWFVWHQRRLLFKSCVEGALRIFQLIEMFE